MVDFACTKISKLIKPFFVFVLFSAAPNVFASSSNFIAFEIFELSQNNFKNFAGEIGHKFNEKHQARLTIMDVELTERHLSSVEAAAIDGSNVEGIFRGYEINYDRYFTKSWYVSLNAGHYTDIYQHQILRDQRLKNETFTIGTGVGYLKQNPIGLKNAYLNFNVPLRYYFDSIDETSLGDTRVREHLIVNNFWLFLGIHF